MGSKQSHDLPLFQDSQSDLTPLGGETRRDRMVRLAGRLIQLGVSSSQIQKLLLHDLDLVERQLDWLPFRSARKRASLIVAAIEHDYEAPANWEVHED